MSPVFNYRKFYEALDRARKQRNNMAWNKVATRAGMQPSSLHGFVNQFEKPNSPAKALSVENLVRLLHWLKKTDIADFLADEDEPNGTVQ